MALRRIILAVAGAAAFAFPAHAAPPAVTSAYLPTTCQPSVSGDCVRAIPVTNPDGTNIGGGSGGTYTGPAAAQLPASLGAKTVANSLTIAPATDGVFPTIGNVASAATDSGNPVKVGCIYNSSRPTFTTGQRADAQCNSRGGLEVSALSAAGADAATNNLGMFQDDTGTARSLSVYASLFNGTTWDRQRGDTTGAWIGGHGSMAPGQVSVGTTATLVAAARAGRQKILLTVTSAVACSYGNAGVTVTTGFPLQAVAGAAVTLDTSAAIYAACASTATVGFVELY